MKRKMIVAIFGLVIAVISCYGYNQGNKVEDLIRKLDSELEAALEKGDSATVDRLLADDYIEINAQGDARGKTQVMALARAKGAAPKVIRVGPKSTVSKFSVRVHGDSALVTGLRTTEYQFMENQTLGLPASSQNPASVNQERFMRVYAKVSGRWQLLAWQTTGVAKR